MRALAFRNELLARLPEQTLNHWLSRMSLRELSKGHHIDLDPRQRMLYFPIDCVIGVRIRLSSGPWAFLRFTGYRFVFGLVDMLKAGDIYFDGWVCGAGHVLVLPATVIERQLPDTFLGAAPHATAMARIAENGIQSAFCASHHGTAQRLAKTLLQAADCFARDESITLSQMELADILSARRETIAALLGALNAAGIVESHRARQIIRKRDLLLSASCECYQISQKFYDDEMLLWKSIQWRDPPAFSPTL